MSGHRVPLSVGRLTQHCHLCGTGRLISYSECHRNPNNSAEMANIFQGGDHNTHTDDPQKKTQAQNDFSTPLDSGSSLHDGANASLIPFRLFPDHRVGTIKNHGPARFTQRRELVASQTPLGQHFFPNLCTHRIKRKWES